MQSSDDTWISSTNTHSVYRRQSANHFWIPSDPEKTFEVSKEEESEEEEGPPKKKQKQLSKGEKKQQQIKNPNLTAMQAHLFHLLRPLVAEHHNVRDALAKCRVGQIDAFENVLSLTEQAVKEGIMAYEKEHANEMNCTAPVQAASQNRDEKGSSEETSLDPHESSLATVARCKRPWWVCQPYVRPGAQGSHRERFDAAQQEGEEEA